MLVKISGYILAILGVIFFGLGILLFSEAWTLHQEGNDTPTPTPSSKFSDYTYPTPVYFEYYVLGVVSITVGIIFLVGATYALCFSKNDRNRRARRRYRSEQQRRTVEAVETLDLVYPRQRPVQTEECETYI